MTTDKFRPVHWSHIESGQIIAWGVERKKAGERHYKPVGLNGEVCPFKTKEEAQAKCDELNAPHSSPSGDRG